MEFKKYISKFLRKRKKKLSEKELALSSRISQIIGQPVFDLDIYQEAFSLKSSSLRTAKNYERLEFLGDSILGSIISCYLFEHYPQANEGYLTQMKSKIVNRKNLNKIGQDLRLPRLIQNHYSSALSENIAGNLFEALIGAVYLDIGYEACQTIVLRKLLTAEEIEKLEHKVVSYKGLLLEWSQKRKVPLKYETSQEELPNRSIVFRTQVYLGEEKISNALEASKKKAEEKAAQRAFYTLNKKEHILEKPKTAT